MTPEHRPEQGDRHLDHAAEVDRPKLRRSSRRTRRLARIESTILSSRSTWRSASSSQRRAASGSRSPGRPSHQLDARPDHGERRPQLVGDDRDETGPGLVDRPKTLELGLGLGLEPAFLNEAR